MLLPGHLLAKFIRKPHMNKEVVVHVRHVPQLGFKIGELQIKLLGGLGVESARLTSGSINILLNDDEVRSRSVERCGIAPQAIENICGVVVM
jgi:hypothetical protein